MTDYMQAALNLSFYVQLLLLFYLHCQTSSSFIIWVYKSNNITTCCWHSNINKGLKKTRFSRFEAIISVSNVHQHKSSPSSSLQDVLMRGQRTLFSEADRYILVLHFNEYIYFCFGFLYKRRHHFNNHTICPHLHVAVAGCTQTLKFDCNCHLNDLNDFIWSRHTENCNLLRV